MSNCSSNIRICFITFVVLQKLLQVLHWFCSSNYIWTDSLNFPFQTHDYHHSWETLTLAYSVQLHEVFHLPYYNTFGTSHFWSLTYVCIPLDMLSSFSAFLHNDSMYKVSWQGEDPLFVSLYCQWHYELVYWQSVHETVSNFIMYTSNYSL